MPEAQVSARVQSPLARCGGGGLNVRIQGEDLAKLTEIANEIEQVVHNALGAVDPNNSAQLRDPEVRAILDRERLADLRLNATQVSDAMRTMVGGTVVTSFGQTSAGRVQFVDRQRRDRANSRARHLPLVVDNQTTVRLDQVANIVKDAEDGPYPARPPARGRDQLACQSARLAVWPATSAPSLDAMPCSKGTS